VATQVDVLIQALADTQAIAAALRGQNESLQKENESLQFRLTAAIENIRQLTTMRTENEAASAGPRTGPPRQQLLEADTPPSDTSAE
jgi:regulator of replication initiation timing